MPRPGSLVVSAYDVSHALLGQTMTLRQREFMLAAISTGEGHLQAMIPEIVPHLRARSSSPW